MDALIEFCRTRELAPLHKGMTATQVAAILGPPDKTKWWHGEPNLQTHRYGSLHLRISCPETEPAYDENLRLRAFTVSFNELPLHLHLPALIAQQLTRPWASARLEDVLETVNNAGLTTTLHRESSTYGSLYQVFVIGEKRTTLAALDGNVERIAG